MAQAAEKEFQKYILMLNLSQKKAILAMIKAFLQSGEHAENNKQAT